MDKSKSKDNLRAAGKKRLEEFRQKKQQKSGTTKPTGSALKVLAEEDKLLSSASSSPRTPSHGESQLKSEETDHSCDDCLPSTLEVPQTTADSNREGFKTENHHIPADRSLDHSTVPDGNNELLAHSEAGDAFKPSTGSELVYQSTVTEETSNAGRADLSLVSTISLENANSSRFRGEDHTSNQGGDQSEALLLYTEAETSAVAREMGIHLGDAQKSGEAMGIKSLLAEVESLQLRLRITQQEKEQLRVDLQSAQGELQNRTNQSGQEMSAAHEAVNQARPRESFLPADVEAAKLDGKVVPQLERLQKQLTERDTEAMELKEELSTSKDLLVKLQEERSSLVSEVGKFRAELQALGQEKLQLASELETSRRCFQTVESEKEQLLSEKVFSMQQVQDLVDKNAQVTDDLRESVERLRNFEHTKEHELDALKVQIESFAAESVRLVKERDAERACLNELRVQKAELLADMDVERKELRESVEKLQTSEMSKEHELEALRVHIASIAAENSRLLEEFDVERTCLNEMRVESAQLLADMNVEREDLKQLSEKLDAERVCLDEMRVEKAQLVASLNVEIEELRGSVEKHKSSELTKDRELEACRVQISSILAENVRLAEELGAERASLIEMRVEKAQILASSNVEIDDLRATINKLQNSELNKERELEACRMQISSISAENDRLADELDAERVCLNEVRVEKAQLLADLHVEREELERFGEVKLDLHREVDALKTLVKDLRCENTSLLSSYDAELDVARLELQKIEAAYSEQANHLTESREELQRISEEHVGRISRLEMALDECRKLVHSATEGKIEITDELNCVKSNLLLLTEQRELAVANLGTELQESKELVRLTEEQNSSLVKLLEEARSEMQRVLEENAQSVSELESELDKQKLLLTEEEVEKGRLVAELQELREQLDATQLSLRDRQAEIDKYDEEVKQLGENRTKLSSELHVSRDELTRLQGEKSHADLHVRALKEQIAELEVKYSAGVEALRDTEAELGRERDYGLKHSRELEVELEKEKGMRSELSAVNDRLALQIQGVQERLEVLQQEMEMSVKNHESEMAKHEEHLRDIEEDRTKLTGVLSMSGDELTKLREEKARAELDLRTCKEHLARLEEEMADSVEKRKAETAVHEESIRELEEGRSKLKTQLLSCQDELGKLQVETDEVQQELVAQMEQLKAIEALNKDTAEELAEAKQRADAHVQERAVLLTAHGSEIARLREQLSHLEGLNAVSTSDIVQLLGDLEALRKEKEVACSQVEIWKEDCRKLAEEKSKFSDDLMRSKDELQLVIGDKELHQAKLCTELGYYKEHVERLSDEKATLLEELEVTREHLRGASDEKMNEIEVLLKQVEELSQSKEQAVNELAAAFQRVEKVETTRIELVSKLEVVQRQLEDLSRDNESLITNLDVSRQQYVELEKEKAMLLSGFEVSVNNWEAERSDLQQALEASKEIQSVFAAEKDGMASDLAIAKQRMEDLVEVQAQAAAELGSLKRFIESSDEERAQLVAQLNARDQQLESLVEEKHQLTSDLQTHSERILGLTEEVARLTEELNSYKHTLQVSEVELSRQRVELKSPESKLELLKEERVKHVDDVLASGEEEEIVGTELLSHSSEERTQNRSFEPRQAVQSVEDLDGLTRQIETKIGELTLLKTQYIVLQTQLESSDKERNILAQELVTLRQQLQQLSESKSHVANELALGVEASRQRMLEYEEAKSESTSEVKKSKQDPQVLVAEDPSSWEGNQVIQGDSVELAGASLKKRSPRSRSDDSIVGLGSGVSKLIGEFERKAHAGQEQAEQLRRAVHENMRLTASVQRLESERHMLGEAPAQIADLQRQLEGLEKQISELKAEKDAAVGALFAAQAELRQSKEMVKEGNSMLADRLEVLEESVISLHTERDVLVGTLVEVEKGLIHGSKQTLRDLEDKGSGLGTAPYSDLVAESGPLVLQDVTFLSEKLEHAALEAFPDAALELASLRGSKSAVEYCVILCDKLLTGDTGVYSQLHKAHLQLTEIRQRLTQSEEKLILVQQERDSVVQATQGYADQLAHQIADKAAVQAEVSALQARIAELESSLSVETHSRSMADSELKAIISKHWGEGADVQHEMERMQQRYEAREFELSTVNRKLVEAAGTIAQQADEIKRLLLQTERLSEELEKINTEKESFQSSIAQAEQKLSLTREKLSMAVNKGKAVVQQRDALKQSLSEKAKLVEELKATHEEELRVKDAALKDMEKKMSELEAFKEEYIQLETRCSFLQEVVAGADKVLQDSDHLVEGLSTLLESSLSTKDWHAYELVEKIVWITSGTSKVLQKMESANGEKESVTSTSGSPAKSAEEAQARAEMLALELSSLKLEKDELVSHFEEMRSSLHIELQQKIDEKSHLTSLIRQLDLDVETLRQVNESMHRRLEEQATDLVAFEGDITTLRKTLAEREEQWHQEGLRHQNLQDNICNIARNLVDIHESLPPFEGDINSAQSSLTWCKQFMHMLVGRYNLIVEKLDEVARQSAESICGPEQRSSDSVSNKPVDQLSLKSVSTDLIKEVEGIFALVEKQAGEAASLLQRIKKQADEIAVADSEKLRLQQELSNAERRLSTIREKLSSAVTKGKALVQQRDALKQALGEKNDELASVIAAHQMELQDKDAALHETRQKLDAAKNLIDSSEKELAVLKTSVGRDVELSSTHKISELERILAELQDKDSALHETSQKLDVAVDRVDSLEKALSVLKTSIRRVEEPSSTDRISELEKILAETRLKVSSAESEEQGSRNAADLVSAELEQSRRTVEGLAAQVKSVTQERDDLVEQLESSKSQHKDEVEEFMDEREKLVTTIGELENIISRQKDDMESLMRNFEELNESYNSLNAQSIEDATETTNLQDEINSLHNHIAELELTMEMEAAARQKLEADSDGVVANIQEVIQDGWRNKSISLSENDSAGSDTTSLLEEVSSALIAKYKAVVQEVEELSEQVSLLSNLEETSKAKTFSEQDSLSRMKQMLELKDVELSQLSKRMEEAAINMAQQEDLVQGIMQQVNKLRGEVAKTTGERDAFQAELEMAEQRTASTREKLSLAVKKGKKVVQQRDALKQSLAEQELLLANCREEIERKDSTLARISGDLMTSSKQVQGLESEVASLRALTSTLEHDLQDRNSLIEALETVMETALGSYCTVNDWRSEKLLQKANWLVSTFADTESRALSSCREAEIMRRELTQLRTQFEEAQYQAEALKRETAQLDSQLRDAQYHAEALKKESRHLDMQLREAQSQVAALRKESTQVGTQLRDAQYQLECEKEKVSILTKKLEKSESELQWNQLRTAELEAQLPALGLAHQQADILSENVRKLEALLKQKDDKVRNLESILEQKQADVRRAEEAVYAWAGRSEETEAYVRGSQIRIAELESQVRALSGFQEQAEQLSNQVKSLEEVVQQKQVALKTSEASRTKAVNKLTTTVNKFRELCQQSEGLVVELERVQGSVESKDLEIHNMKEDVGRSRALAQVLQARLDSRNSLLMQLEEGFKSASPLGGDVELPQPVNSEASMREQEAPEEGEDLFLTNVKLIQRRLEAFVAQSQSWQSELAKKESQLKGLRKELDEANGEKVSLKTSLQREQTQFERFKADYATKYSPAAERESLKVEEIEEVQAGKRSMPSTSAAPHVRGARKPPSLDVSIDMDFESSRLMEVSDEKGHGFKALASARFMPRGTRFIADRIDRIWYADKLRCRRTGSHETTWCPTGSYIILACNSYLDGSVDSYGTRVAVAATDFATNKYGIPFCWKEREISSSTLRHLRVWQRSHSPDFMRIHLLREPSP